MAKFWDTKFGSKLKGAGNWILNTLDEMNGKITPSIAEGVSYNTGRLTYGLFVKDTTEINWDKNVIIPETFSISIRISIRIRISTCTCSCIWTGRKKRNFHSIYKPIFHNYIVKEKRQ